MKFKREQTEAALDRLLAARPRRSRTIQFEGEPVERIEIIVVSTGDVETEIRVHDDGGLEILEEPTS